MTGNGFVEPPAQADRLAALRADKAVRNGSMPFAPATCFECGAEPDESHAGGCSHAGRKPSMGRGAKRAVAAGGVTAEADAKAGETAAAEPPTPLGPEVIPEFVPETAPEVVPAPAAAVAVVLPPGAAFFAAVLAAVDCDDQSYMLSSLDKAIDVAAGLDDAEARWLLDTVYALSRRRRMTT